MYSIANVPMHSLFFRTAEKSGTYFQMDRFQIFFQIIPVRILFYIFMISVCSTCIYCTDFSKL